MEATRLIGEHHFGNPAFVDSVDLAVGLADLSRVIVLHLLECGQHFIDL